MQSDHMHEVLQNQCSEFSLPLLLALAKVAWYPQSCATFKGPFNGADEEQGSRSISRRIPVRSTERQTQAGTDALLGQQLQR